MSFNSSTFILLFLPISVAVYWLLPPRFRGVGLLAESLTFYAYAGLIQALQLCFMIVMTYGATHYLMSKERWRGWGLGLALINVIILVYAKYSVNVNSVSGQGTAPGLLGAAIPLGISFYTFNLVGYSIDIYRKRITPARSLLDFAAYITFFPTLLAGPLVRYANFAKQESNEFDLNKVEQGIFCFSLGLAKKIILADTFAKIANPLFAHYGDLGMIGAWLAALAYTYQLYFDFSGYTDMAIGVGCLLGFKLPPNFNAPYTARTITDFWQRWHITLSTWFRDYVFTPFSRMALKLDGNRHPALIRTLGLFLIMTLIGLWHGLSWTFAIWGIYQGVLLAIHAQTRRPDRPQWLSVTGRFLTFFLVLIGWVMFRSPSVTAAVNLYGAMFGLRGLGYTDLIRVLPQWSKVVMVSILIMAFILTNLPSDTWNLRLQRNWLFVAGVSFLFVICLILTNQPSQFLYLQF